MGNLGEVVRLFLKLGFIAFGGPAAHIAMMQEELIEKRRWISNQEFLDLMGATNLIPGPNSTEMVMHCGYHRAGYAGLVFGGMAFILPAVLLTGLLAVFYVSFSHLSVLEPILAGIKAAVMIVIAGALYKLSKKSIKNVALMVLAVVGIIAYLLGLHEVLTILGCGILYLMYTNGKNHAIALPLLFAPMFGKIATSGGIFWIFLKTGAILFGSGYVLLAYLDADLVQRLEWLTRSQLIEAIAIGQFTPGPVLSTSTFIGYILQGWKGAVLATVGIFLPSFFFVALISPHVKKIRKYKWASKLLDGINVGAVALMAVVTVEMGVDIFAGWKPILIAAISAILWFGVGYKNTMVHVLGGGLLGYFLGFL